MRDALHQLVLLRKRGQRPVGPVVVTHSPYVAKYYRDLNRAMFTVLVGREPIANWSALAGLDVFLIDWSSERRHVETAQQIVATRPRIFSMTRWNQDASESIRASKTVQVLAA